MAGPIDALITEWSDDFDQQIADSTVNRIDASSEYTFNIGRHAFYDNGTFINDIADTTALDDLEGKFQITASANDEHIFAARELVRYVPSYELLVGAAAWAENELTEGQHFAIEFAQDTFDAGYRYHFEGTADGPKLTLEQQSNGQGTITNDAELDELESRTQFDHTRPFVARLFVNWYGAGNARFTLSYPRPHESTNEIMDQENPIIGRTANREDVATVGANQRIQVRVWADAGADTFTVNVCSLGAVIRGNATEIDREKPAIFYFSAAQNSISQYPTDNVDDALAARIDPTRNNVAVKCQPPLFRPAGTSVTMELSVYAVHKDNPDLTVNFDDPDDDGTDEGPAPAAQARGQTDVMQYTRNVTSIPTTTDIRADGTTGLIPDMRHLTTTVGESSGGTSIGASTGGELANIKRNVYKDDVIILLPRSDPNSNTSDGRIRWMKPMFEQDW